MSESTALSETVEEMVDPSSGGIVPVLWGSGVFGKAGLSRSHVALARENVSQHSVAELS